MNKPATKTDENLARLLPENKLANDGDKVAESTSCSISPGQEVSVHPLQADLIWLGRYPLIDSHK